MRYLLGLFAPSIGQVDQLIFEIQNKTTWFQRPRAARHHLDAIITNEVFQFPLCLVQNQCLAILFQSHLMEQDRITLVLH